MQAVIIRIIFFFSFVRKSLQATFLLCSVLFVVPQVLFADGGDSVEFQSTQNLNLGDSITEFSNIDHTVDAVTLKLIADNNSGSLRTLALQKLHRLVLERFDSFLLQKFYEQYGQEFTDIEKNENLRLALLAESLRLHLPYKSENFKFYDDFITQAAPSDMAFKALQNLITPDLTSKKYTQAISVVKKYQIFFGHSHPKIKAFLHILQAKPDNSVTVRSLSEIVNTTSGSEFSPVFPSGEKLMYFCGTGRNDNLGGEDIFVSERNALGWNVPSLITEFSSANFNDAPVSVSPDGNQMLFVHDGKFFTARKTVSAWTEPELLNGPFYNIGRVIDGVFTPDGKGILFSALLPDKVSLAFNYHSPYNFRSSGIFVSLRNEAGKWTEPLSLGSKINTSGSQRSPFLHADGKTLYFSSDGHGGLGMTDVFMSVRLADSCWNCWSEPVNLGKELNTPGHDFGFKINTSGDKAYFARSANVAEVASVLVIIDVSGSMSGLKLARTKTFAASLLKNSVQTNAELAVLTFAGTCNKPFVDSVGFSASLHQKYQFIENLTTTGKTTTSEAYRAAVSYLRRNTTENSGEKIIVVFTDEDECVCNKSGYAYGLMHEALAKKNISSLVFDVSEDSVLFSNLRIENKAFAQARISALLDKTEQIYSAGSNLNLKGDEDLYEAVLPAAVRPGAVSTVSGKITSKDMKPVSAQIEWHDAKTGNNLGVLFSNPSDGSYYLVLPHGRFYGYFAKADSLVNESYHIDLEKETRVQHIEKDLQLFKIDELVASGQALRLNNVFFNFDESTLLQVSKTELNRWADIIRRENLQVEISGHTDSEGEELYNLSLSEKRAEAVKNFLISNGCDAHLLITVGYGESKPRTNNLTEQDRAENRRVELKITGRK